jgi:hypothetical protein
MIHSVLGTPEPELLSKIKQRSQHFPANFEFPPEEGTGIAELLLKPEASPECVDLINRLLAYDPDTRLCAHQVRFQRGQEVVLGIGAIGGQRGIGRDLQAHGEKL